MIALNKGIVGKIIKRGPRRQPRRRAASSPKCGRAALQARMGDGSLGLARQPVPESSVVHAVPVASAGCAPRLTPVAVTGLDSVRDWKQAETVVLSRNPWLPAPRWNFCQQREDAAGGAARCIAGNNVQGV